MSKTSATPATDWGSIKWNSSTSADTNFTINEKILRVDLGNIYQTFKATDKEVNAGRKILSCKRCGEPYYEDEGISDGYCNLDCKYFECILKEGKDGENL